MLDLVDMVDYTAQFDLLSQQLDVIIDINQISCGILGFLGGILIVIVLSGGWRY